jgi:hypothetical protein
MGKSRKHTKHGNVGNMELEENILELPSWKCGFDLFLGDPHT